MIRNFFIVVLLLFIVGFVVLKGCGTMQKEQIKELEQKIVLLKKETVPLKFVVLEKNNGMIKFVVKFLDGEQNVIKKDTFSLKGDELSFDFYSVPLNEQFAAFPYKIFTDQIAAREGISLYPLYDKNGFPQIFFTNNLDENSRKVLSETFAKLKADKPDNIEGSFGNMVHDLKQLKEFKTDYVYKVVTHTKGGIEIIME